MIGYVYTLVHPETKQPFYVGSTKVGISQRLQGHHTGLKSGTQPVYQYMRTQGIKPEMEVIEEIDFNDIKELREREKHWIKLFGDGLQNKQRDKYLYQGNVLTIRPKEGSTLRTDLMELAEAKKWSLNQYAILVLEEHVKRKKPKKK